MGNESTNVSYMRFIRPNSVILTNTAESYMYKCILCIVTSINMLKQRVLQNSSLSLIYMNAYSPYMYEQCPIRQHVYMDVAVPGRNRTFSHFNHITAFEAELPLRARLVCAAYMWMCQVFVQHR